MSELQVEKTSHDRNAAIVRAAQGGAAGGAVGATGALALVAAGGSLGSVVPIVGTFVGALAGILIALMRKSNASKLD